MKTKTVTLTQAYRWILKHLFTRRAGWMSLLLVALLTTGLVVDMSRSLVLGHVFDVFLGYKTGDIVADEMVSPWGPLVRGLALFGFLWVLSQVFDYLKSRTEIMLWFETYVSVNVGIFANLSKRSPFQLQQEEDKLGLSAIARFRSATHRVKDMLLFGAAAEALSILIAFGFLVAYNWSIGLIMLGYMVVAFLWANLANKKTAQTGLSLEKEFRKADRDRDVRLGNMASMLHAGNTARDEQRWLRLIAEMRKQHRRMWFRFETHLFARNTFGILVAISAFWVISYQFVHGNLDFALLYPTFVWTKQVWDKAWRFANIDRILQKIGLTIREGVEALLMESIIQDPDEGRIPDIANGLEIVFRDVTFGYDVNEPPVLERVNLILTGASHYGVVGPTGAGKSTLLQLLRGDVMPWSGQVLINGVPTTEINLTWWRQQWQYCPQDPHPYPGTIRDVLTYLLPDGEEVDDEALSRVLEHFSLEELVRHKKGLGRVILDRGSDLSGGQKQRLMLAMAVLAKSPMLILDEPTSALDPMTESVIQEQFQEADFAIIVAHRLSTVRDGRIVEIRNGQAYLYDSLGEACTSSDFVQESAALQQVA